MRRSLAGSCLFFGAAFPLLGACTFGPRMETLPFAHGPEGVRVSVMAGGGRDKAEQVAVQGELIEARVDGLVLLTGGRNDPKVSPASTSRRLVLVQHRFLEEARLEGVGRSLAGGASPGADELEKLRRLSRFPQGLRPELLAALLHDCGQREVEVWRR